MAVKIGPIIGETNGHIWRKYTFISGEYTCCQSCGVIRRKKDDNNHCKGKVKVKFK